MPALTDEGRRVVDGLAQRHAFSREATEHMLVAVLNGNGHMAQFSHSEFGGSGQWMRGGMTMIGDMFNNYLKGRVDSLCSDIASQLSNHGGLYQSGSFQSQSQSGSDSQYQEAGGLRGNSSLFAPDPSRNWWPQDLGQPNALGNQNQMHYAYFAAPRRLAVKTGSSVWVYDTLNHQIGGFAQQQGSNGGISFSSQFGTIDLSSLPVVSRDGQAAIEPAMQPVAPSMSIPEITTPSTYAPPTQATNSNEGDVIAMLERLGDLKAKGILTEGEFNDKKRELLARI
ncbi:MAG: SHOCT domain-containing protein [Pirellulaceae bacterium]|nr:SHOCT domain-containing protein [Pirellulaceae bacterium]